MKAAFAWFLILGFVALAVLALVFRSQQARDVLRFGRNAIWVYIAIVFALGALELYRRGF